MALADHAPERSVPWLSQVTTGLLLINCREASPQGQDWLVWWHIGVCSYGDVEFHVNAFKKRKMKIQWRVERLQTPTAVDSADGCVMPAHHLPPVPGPSKPLAKRYDPS